MITVIRHANGTVVCTDSCHVVSTAAAQVHDAPAAVSQLPIARQLPLRSNGGRARAMAAYEWRCATSDAAFEPRDGAGLLSFKGKLWLLGGWNPWCEDYFPHPSDTNSEVWSSADGGASWTLETIAPWPGRHCAGWLVHDDGGGEKLFVVGGDASPPVGYDTDVWSSSDGRDWTLVTPKTPWTPRAGPYTVSFGGYMWVMGGQAMGSPDTTVGFAAARSSAPGSYIIIYIIGSLSRFMIP